MCSRVFWERLTDWLSVITCLWYGIHSSAQSSYINIFTKKNLFWMSTEESDIFVVLSFHLLGFISDDSAA